MSNNKKNVAIVSSSDMTTVDNWSAAFWTLPTAKKENFDKTVSDEEYSIVAEYFHKVFPERGISTSLAKKIHDYLKLNYNRTTIEELFTKEEIAESEEIIVYAYNNAHFTLDKDRVNTFEEFLQKTKKKIILFDALKKKMSQEITNGPIVPGVSSSYCLNKENTERWQTAKEYLSFVNSQRKKVTFSAEERIQFNVVILHVVELAKQERDLEVSKLQARIARLNSL